MECFDQLKPEMRDLLRTYLARNGSYRSNELLHAAYNAAPDETTGVKWILSLAGAASRPEIVLRDLDGVTWLSAIAQQAILSREFDLLQQQPRAIGPDGSTAWCLARSGGSYSAYTSTRG